MENGTQEMKPVAGLAGVVIRAWQNRRNLMTRPERTLRLVESLSLGGRKQVHLVCCGEQQFLIGGGAEAVHCITPVTGTSTVSLDTLRDA